MLLRHLLAIALLPFVVVVLVPRWLLGLEPLGGIDASATPLLAARTLGALVFLAGLALFTWSVLLLRAWDAARSRRGIRRGASSSSDRTATCVIR